MIHQWEKLITLKLNRYKSNNDKLIVDKLYKTCISNINYLSLPRIKLN